MIVKLLPDNSATPQSAVQSVRKTDLIAETILLSTPERIKDQTRDRAAIRRCFRGLSGHGPCVNALSDPPRPLTEIVCYLSGPDLEACRVQDAAVAPAGPAAHEHQDILGLSSAVADQLVVAGLLRALRDAQPD